MIPNLQKAVLHVQTAKNVHNRSLCQKRNPSFSVTFAVMKFLKKTFSAISAVNSSLL